MLCGLVCRHDLSLSPPPCLFPPSPVSSSSLGFSISQRPASASPESFAFQVLPHVLHVCELGLCGADAAEDTELEATLSILPLVGAHFLTLPTAISYLS